MENSLETGVAGVYNPITEEIEWNTAWNSGIAGVFNPITEEIEWKKTWHRGVSGYYNPESEEIIWDDYFKSGIVAISTFDNYQTTHSYSYIGVIED